MNILPHMHKLLLHPLTRIRIDDCITCPGHAVMLEGPSGVGKKTIARYIASEIIGITPDKLELYPYFACIEHSDSSVVSIDDVRSLKTFVALKIPGDKEISRILLICDAQSMTIEAQNALLKLLEEPPLDTLILMTVSQSDALLDTVRSRVRRITVTPPAADQASKWFTDLDYDPAAVSKSLSLSGGLPGLMQALLTTEETHPLYSATVRARTLLGGKAFDRLVLVDALSKQKQEAIDTLFIVGQMARMTLMKSSLGKTDADRWKHILTVSYQASEQLKRNAQPKLVLTNLMLEL